MSDDEQLQADQIAEGAEVEDIASEEAQANIEGGDDEPVANGHPTVDEDTLCDEDFVDDGVSVQEHLKDAVVGSLRLKRLLTRDDDESNETGEGPSQKRRRTSEVQGAEEETIGKGLLAKWGLQDDKVMEHVLHQIPLDELTNLRDTNYMPDKNNQWKSPAELLAKFVCEVRERKLAGGSALDAIANFRFRMKFDVQADKKIRALCHKDLRYVLDNFKNGADLDEVIAAAALTEPADDNTTIDSVPEVHGPSACGRFNRLELIDPLADCCVFGDANLTFSLKLAKHRKALGHVGRVIATTFEELETLRERYKEIDEVIATLETLLCEVYHGVDCTRIALDPQFKGLEGTFGAVYYNFPHSGAIQGFFDGHPLVNWRHENLMRLFFRALRSFVKPGGIVKVSSNMGAVGVRYSYIVSSAIENEFTHVETIPFLEWTLHRYGRSYGDRRDAYKRPDAVNNQSYNAQRADADMVYCFKYEPTGNKLPPQMIRLPPTLKTLVGCLDGPFKHLQGEAKKNLAKQLHTRFLTEVSGTHVG